MNALQGLPGLHPYAIQRQEGKPGRECARCRRLAEPPFQEPQFPVEGMPLIHIPHDNKEGRVPGLDDVEQHLCLKPALPGCHPKMGDNNPEGPVVCFHNRIDA